MLSPVHVRIPLLREFHAVIHKLIFAANWKSYHSDLVYIQEQSITPEANFVIIALTHQYGTNIQICSTL